MADIDTRAARMGETREFGEGKGAQYLQEMATLLPSSFLFIHPDNVIAFLHTSSFLTTPNSFDTCSQHLFTLTKYWRSIDRTAAARQLSSVGEKLLVDGRIGGKIAFIQFTRFSRIVLVQNFVRPSAAIPSVGPCRSTKLPSCYSSCILASRTVKYCVLQAPPFSVTVSAGLLSINERGGSRFTPHSSNRH